MLKANFSLDLEHVLPPLIAIGFHSTVLQEPYPFQKFYRVYHHPNEIVQNILEHSHENISYQVWHGMKPLNLQLKNQ